jgi:hypothetical protein
MCMSRIYHCNMVALPLHALPEIALSLLGDLDKAVSIDHVDRKSAEQERAHVTAGFADGQR